MSFLLDQIFPRTCSGCGKTGDYLCDKCKDTLTHKGIGTPKESPIEGCLSLFRYKGAIKQLISDLKFKFVTEMADELADLMVYTLINNYPHLLRYWQENKFILIPIPLHPRRLAWRGFNQSELISQKLSTKLNLGYQSNILVRTRNTTPQASIRDRLLRRTNTQSAFLFRSDLLNSNKFLNFIIIDDVYTSGSTIKSAVSIFPEDSKTWALTLAG